MEQIVEWVNQARCGEKAAWERLIQLVYSEGLSQARMLLRDQTLAEDALQNSLLKVYRYISSLEDPAAFKAWFKRILMNEVFLMLRSKKKEIEGLDTSLILDYRLSLDEQVTMKVEIFRAIRLLPFEQQQVLVEVDIRGEALQKVADDYHLPLGTVKSRLYRARLNLQRELNEFNPNRKGGEKMSGNSMTKSISEKFYDYLEGTMNSQEKVEFEKELLIHPEWDKELEQHKDFLTLFHILTGSLSLSAQEIAEKVQQVSDQIQDYEMVQEQTYFDAAGPKTLVSRLWFKKPGQYRIEASNPMMGESVMVIRGQVILSWAKDAKQAQRAKLKQEMKDQIAPNYGDALKRMAADKNSRVLGTEYVEGRSVLHIQFSEKVANMDEMNTHSWLDKETWMPIVTEQYNSAGKLVFRTIVRELRLNKGIPDEQFKLEIPADITIQEEDREISALREITVDEASQFMKHSIYVLQEQKNVKHQWMQMMPEKGVMLSQYSRTGEPIPFFTLTQGQIPHYNLPHNVTTEQIPLFFNGDNIDGMYVNLDLGAVMTMIIWEYQGTYYTAGGAGGKEEILSLIQNLQPALEKDK